MTMKYKKSQEQDAQLVESFRNGNQTAFESLVDKYYPDFCEYIKNQFSSLEVDAGEIVNDSFLKFHKNPQQLKKPGSFRSWLKTTIHYECIHRKEDLIRSNELSNDMESSAPDLVEELIHREGEKIIHTILYTFFSNSNGPLLFNKYIKKMTYKEIAKIEIARIDEGNSNGSTVKQTEKPMEKRLENKAKAIKTQVNDLKKTFMVLLLAYSNLYFDKFLTAEEIGKELGLPVMEVKKRLSSAHKQYNKHFDAAFKTLPQKKQQILRLRVDADEDFQRIAEGRNKENLKVQTQWYDAKTELENELIKMGITNTIKNRILTRDEKMAEKRKRSA